MERVFKIATKNPLFQGFSLEEFQSIFNCLGGRIKTFKKGEYIYMVEDEIKDLAVIIEGEIKIIKEDNRGNLNILTKLGAGDIFGEAFVCAGVTSIPIGIEAISDTEILFVNYKKVITTCSSNCSFHNMLIDNMIKILANKNIFLNKKIEIISKRSIKEKVMAFLDMKNSSEKNLKINYNREEMAEYLCVDRSALSYELSKMKKEGLIDYKGNEFKIKW